MDNDSIEIYEEAPEEKSIEPKKKKNFWKWVWKNRELSTIFFLLFVILVTYGWAKLKINKLEKDFKEEKTELVKNHKLHEKNSLEKQLKLLARPLSWAIRGELIDGNHRQIESYAKVMIAEPGFKDILVSGINDEIVVTTNILYKNKSIDLFFPFEFTEPSETATYQLPEKNEIIVVTPIKNKGTKLGMLIFSHEAD